MDGTSLATLREIEQLKYRYLRTLDLKDWDGFADTLAPEVVADYGGGKLSFTGRDQVVDFMRTSLGPAIITVHHCHHPEIELDGDTARAHWYLEDQVIITEHRLVLTGAAFYDDRYVRRDGRWWITATGYERTFEAMQSLDDTPSWRLTANRWAAPSDAPAPA